jgi:hypothetical protein
MDLLRLREKCDRLQWSVDDLDWDAPGAETVTGDRARALAPFMADLFWIESLAALVFGAMAKTDPDPTHRAIFESFAIDEERHAAAERALMVRWGILARHDTPTQNPSIATLYRLLERHAHEIHPAVFSAIIPMTELVLDGALVKYLVKAVDDPVCHLAFDRINADEARHLAMDFHVLEHWGKHAGPGNVVALLGTMLRPTTLYATFFGYFPMLARSRQNLEAMGMDMEEAAKAMRRYIELGEKNPDIARHPTYRIMRAYVERVTTGHDGLPNLLLRVSDFVDRMKGARAAA